jgi:hypothetical protein
MPTATHSKESIIEAIKECAKSLGRTPSRSAFISHSRISEYYVLSHFSSWTDAVSAAGLQPDTSNQRLADEQLLEDWGAVVRIQRSIPTRHAYRKIGNHSLSMYDKRFGAWSSLPDRFRQFATNRTEWADVVTLLPVHRDRPTVSNPPPDSNTPSEILPHHHERIEGRQTYGNPIDFRGLRHEPVNENGVVFLFGMVARELGYSVEAVQSGFPDCEAKRQIKPGAWQRVHIEFEFQSRNFRDHGHPVDGCDLIVCWHHNWPECPLEVVELRSILQGLATSDE